MKKSCPSFLEDLIWLPTPWALLAPVRLASLPNRKHFQLERSMPNMRTKAFSIKGIDAQHVRVESEAITTVLPTGKHLGSHSAIPLKDICWQ